MLACGLIMLPLMGHAQDCRKKSNDVIETIMARRSIRNYLNKPVEHEKLAIVAKCGINGAKRPQPATMGRAGGGEPRLHKGDD